MTTKYAEVSWSPEDVSALKPEWDLGRCEAELSRIEKHLRDRTIELGWEVMETLLDD